MIFKRRGKYQLVSDCGRYSICKWNMPEAIYFAYRKEGNKFVKLGGTCGTAQEAQDRCRQDVRDERQAVRDQVDHEAAQEEIETEATTT